MILRVPQYYHTFKCIAGDCKDSCCIGWEIDIDEDTYDYYNDVEGSFGDRLRQNMISKEEHSFILNGKRCPFLNGKNLCDICIHLGEEALSEVCTEYPRFTVEFGNVREKSMAISCEEVGRLLFENSEKTQFTEMEIPDCYDICASQDDFPESHIKEIQSVRDAAITILQNRQSSIKMRVYTYLKFAAKVQELLNQEELEDTNFAEKIKVLIEKYTVASNTQVRTSNAQSADQRESGRTDSFAMFHSRMDCLSGMELLDEEWDDYFREMQASYTPENYQETLQNFLTYYEDRCFEYEHLLVYFTFRYFTKAVYDSDLLGKAKFAVLGFLTIRDMDALRFYKTGVFTKEDRIDVARIYAKEVEHSEDNMEYLLEEFVFNEIFETEKLCQQI